MWVLVYYITSYIFNLGVVCTDKDVSACSKEAKECKSFESPDKEMFAQMFPDAYAEVCVESTGEQCLYTDVEYETCDHAKMSES